MRWCTRIKVIGTDGDRITDAEILDISIVGDDHGFGVDELTGEVHWEADFNNQLDGRAPGPVS